MSPVIAIITSLENSGRGKLRREILGSIANSSSDVDRTLDTIKAMDIIPLAILAQTIPAVWKDPNEKKLYSKAVYVLRSVYRVFAVTLVCLITVLVSLNVYYSKDNISELMPFVFILFSCSLNVLKLFNYFYRRHEYLEILESLRNGVCMPDNEHEIVASKRSKFYDEYNMAFIISAHLTLVAGNLLPFTQPLSGRHLPMNMKVPYSLANVYIYFTTYLLISIGWLQTAGVFIFVNSLVFQLVIFTTAQYKLLSYRITLAVDLLERDAKLFDVCLRHHVILQKAVRKMESLFMGVITIFLTTSLLSVCTSIFHVTKENVGLTEMCFAVAYIAGLFAQVSLYCLLGHELLIRSASTSEAIYNGKWYSLKAKQRINLQLVMLICQRGSSISYHGLCELNRATLMWILKMSYSAYNLLSQAQQTNLST